MSHDKSEMRFKCLELAFKNPTWGLDQVTKTAEVFVKFVEETPIADVKQPQVTIDPKKVVKNQKGSGNPDILS